VSSPAWAAEPQASAPQEIEEILVTAQRREQSIQSVPMSISAITATDLANRGAVQFTDYAVSVPSLSFGYRGGEARGSGNTIAIRGVSGTNATGYYIDDTPIPYGVDPHLIALERIEVLRGPQGTLYGSGSMGGTIKLVSRQPDPGAFASTVQGVVSSTAEASDLNYSFEGSLNIPLSSVTALAVSAYDDRTAGIYDRIYGEPLPYYPGSVISTAPGRKNNVDASNVYGGRIALLFAPTERLHILPTVYYQKTSDDGIRAADTTPDNFTQYRAYNFDEPFDDEYYLANLTVRLSLGKAELISSTSYFDRKFGEIEDSTEVLDTFLRGAYGNPDAPMLPGTLSNDRDQHRVVQELRLAGKASSIDWLVGAFYEKADIERNALLVFPGMSTNPDYFDFGTGDLGFISDDGSTSKERAAFMDFSWSIGKFELSAGVRYFDNEIEGFRRSGGFLDAGLNLTPADLNQSETGTTPRFAVKYQLTPASMVYASAAKGFRQGGFSVPLPDYCADDLINIGFTGQPGAYNSDRLWSYEAGVKSAWRDNRITVDLAAFRIDWSGIQQQIRLDCGWGFNANVGEARINGFELQSSAEPIRGLELGLALSLNDSEITDPGVNTPAHKGDAVLDTPKWKAAANVQYTLPATSDTEIYVRGDYEFNDKSFSTFNQNNSPGGEPYLPRASFDIFDLRAAMRWVQRDLEVAAFVKNAFDEHANFGPYQSIGVDFPGRPRLATNRPRTFGVSVRKTF
jgi:outer membrane receptor protein involved in Fe transport